MAIIDGIPGLECPIRMNNLPVAEYVDDNEAADANPSLTKQMTTYIESITGEEFAVCLELKGPYQFDCPVVKFLTYVDGVGVSSNKAFKEVFDRKGKVTCFCKGTWAEGGCLPLRFLSIETSRHILLVLQVYD